MGSFYPMLQNVIFRMNFIIFCTQNRKTLADYRMRIPFQMHPTSPRPGAGILPQATEIAILPGTCRKNRKIAGSEIVSLFHRFCNPFWLHFQTNLALNFKPFSALMFGCLVGCLFEIFGRKWSPQGIKHDPKLFRRRPPETHPKRSKITSATQPRLFMDFAWIWEAFPLIFNVF